MEARDAAGSAQVQSDVRGQGQEEEAGGRSESTQTSRDTYRQMLNKGGINFEFASYPITIKDNLFFTQPNEETIWQMKSKQAIAWSYQGVSTEMEFNPALLGVNVRVLYTDYRSVSGNPSTRRSQDFSLIRAGQLRHCLLDSQQEFERWAVPLEGRIRQMILNNAQLLNTDPSSLETSHLLDGVGGGGGESISPGVGGSAITEGVVLARQVSTSFYILLQSDLHVELAVELGPLSGSITLEVSKDVSSEGGRVVGSGIKGRKVSDS
eukprot:762961-Hanusia_phi.AAC.6